MGARRAAEHRSPFRFLTLSRKCNEVPAWVVCGRVFPGVSFLSSLRLVLNTKTGFWQIRVFLAFNLSQDELRWAVKWIRCCSVVENKVKSPTKVKKHQHAHEWLSTNYQSKICSQIIGVTHPLCCCNPCASANLYSSRISKPPRCSAANWEHIPAVMVSFCPTLHHTRSNHLFLTHSASHGSRSYSFRGGEKKKSLLVSNDVIHILSLFIASKFPGPDRHSKQHIII